MTYEETILQIKQLEREFNAKLIAAASQCDEEIAIMPITSFLSHFSNNPITEPVQILTQRATGIVNKKGKLIFGAISHPNR